MRKHLSTIVLLFILLIGLSLLLYPTVSDYWNARHASKAVADYTQNVQALDQDAYDELLAAAEDYNRSLLTRENGFFLTEEQQAQYESLLDISGTGIMGYIEIPSINVSLPIYHGTSDSVLQIAVGHLDWTSLPVGGESTHCVLSGHRGLPSAKLFTNLDKLAVGDTFLLRVLDEVLTYEVDQILIVEPEQVDALGIVPGEDYCTLVTCTPYGINTHRLLVRGHRVENTPEAARMHVTADATQFDPLLVAPVPVQNIPLCFLVTAVFHQHPFHSVLYVLHGPAAVFVLHFLFHRAQQAFHLLPARPGRRFAEGLAHGRDDLLRLVGPHRAVAFDDVPHQVPFFRLYYTILV